MPTTTASRPAISPVLVPMTIWIAAAFAIAASGVLVRVPVLAGLIPLALVITWVALYRSSSGIRAALDRLPLRAVIAAHAIRAPIGAMLLYEHSRGRLPELFAVRAGIGDIAIGVLAVVVALVPRRPRLYAAWSVIGLADILLAVGTAQYLILVRHDPTMLVGFSELPYPLLPVLIVPAVILTHILVLARVRRRDQIGL